MKKNMAILSTAILAVCITKPISGTPIFGGTPPCRQSDIGIAYGDDGLGFDSVQFFSDISKADREHAIRNIPQSVRIYDDIYRQGNKT